MNRIMPLLLLAAETEEKVNITPVLLRFIGKFFLVCVIQLFHCVDQIVR